jgi:hypothetical protein
LNNFKENNMKKKLVIGILVALIALCAMGAALATKTMSFRDLVVSAAGAETDLIAATGYTVGIPDPGTVALSPKNLQTMWGGGDQTNANALQLICYATSDATDTATMSLYGINDSGPPIRIGVIVWTFGAAVRSTGVQWAGTAVATDTHLTSITVADSGNDRVASVGFDAVGYKYIYAITTAQTGTPTGITVQMRPW